MYAIVLSLELQLNTWIWTSTCVYIHSYDYLILWCPNIVDTLGEIVSNNAIANHVMKIKSN